MRINDLEGIPEAVRGRGPAGGVLVIHGNNGGAGAVEQRDAFPGIGEAAGEPAEDRHAGVARGKRGGIGGGGQHEGLAGLKVGRAGKDKGDALEAEAGKVQAAGPHVLEFEELESITPDGIVHDFGNPHRHTEAGHGISGLRKGAPGGAVQHAGFYDATLVQD